MADGNQRSSMPTKPRTRSILQWLRSPNEALEVASAPPTSSILVRTRKRKAQKKKLHLSGCIRGMMVCLWDNVSGPRTEQVWESTTSHISVDMLNYICRYTLGSEVSFSLNSHEESEDPPIAKFHVLPQYDLLVSAVVFTGKYYNNSLVSESFTKWGICVIVDRCQLQRYMQLHRVYEENLIQLGSILQRQLNSKFPSDAIEAMNDRIMSFISHMSVVTNNESPLWHFSSTYLTDQKLPFPREFLSRAITSHLQTHGSSVVIGSPEEADKINMMINTLLLLLPTKERALCSHVRNDNQYVTDLLIQGLTCDFDKTSAMHSLRPTTVIDLTQRSVVQLSVRQHVKAREMFKKYEIDLVEQPKPLPDLLKEESLYKAVKEPSPFVTALLQELLHIPETFRVSYVQNFRNQLEKKALVLIRCVASVADERRRSNIPAAVLKRIRVDVLRTSSDADFALLLAVAERISPGVGVSIFGVAQDDLEKRFNDLWGIN